MPKILTNLLIIGIIGAGITGAYFIIQNPTPVNLTTISKNLNNYLKGNNPVANNPLIARNSDDSSKSVFSGMPEETSNPSQLNLTQAMSKELAENLAKNNPQGPENIEGKKWLNVPDTEQLSEDLITKAAENFDPLAFRPVINDKDLKISSGNTKQNLTNYLSAFNKILRESALKISQPEKLEDIFSEEIFVQTINSLINVHQFAFDEFIKLAAPSSILLIHKEEMELLGTKINIYKKILDYKTDPVTAILAGQESKNIDEEFKVLSEQIKDFIKQNEL